MAGPDGAIWFTNGGGGLGSIDRITADGTVTNYTAQTIQYPWGITSGSDGALWFTNGGGNEQIGRITTSGVISSYGGPLNAPYDITTGPDHALWFTDAAFGGGEGGVISRITTSGVVTHFFDPTISQPHGIASGPDGALWFTNYDGDTIDRITTAGKVTSYTASAQIINHPEDIVTGPDGNLWVTNQRAGSYGRGSIAVITPSGVISTINDPSISTPDAIAVGPDGAIWFTNDDGGPNNTGSIGRITPAGVVSNYTDTTINSPYGIAAGPDGAMWFTNYYGNSIGRITTPVGPPDAPWKIGAAAGTESAAVSWQAPLDNGSPISSYTVTASPGGATTSVSGAQTSATIRGLTNGTPYTFTLTATNASGTSSLSQASPAVTPDPLVSVGDASILEGDSGTRTLIFPVTLWQPSTTNVTVGYQVNGLSATGATKPGAGADFKLKSGTLTFKRNAKTGLTPISSKVSITVYGDAATEQDETLRVDLTNPSSGYILGRRSAIGRIINDDGITSGEALGAGDVSTTVAEAGSQTLKIPVTLSAGAPTPFTVSYTINPGTATYSKTAVGGGDFGGSKLAGTLMFATGKTALTLSVPIWPDTGPDSDETFTVTLSNPTSTTVTLIRPTSTVTIYGD